MHSLETTIALNEKAARDQLHQKELLLQEVIKEALLVKNEPQTNGTPKPMINDSGCNKKYMETSHARSI